MELPVASRPPTSELRDAVRGATGPAAAPGREDSFRTHLQPDAAGGETGPRSPVADAPPPARPAQPEAPPATDDRDTPASPVAAAPTSPAATDQPAQAAPAAARRAADSPASADEPPHPPASASALSRSPRSPRERPQPAAAPTPAEAAPGPRAAPQPAGAHQAVAIALSAAPPPSAAVPAAAAADEPAAATAAAPRRAASARGGGSRRAAAAPGAEGTTAASNPLGTDTGPRSAPRAALASPTPPAGAPVELAQRHETDPNPSEAAARSGPPGEPDARPAGLSQRLAQHLTARGETPNGVAGPVAPTEQQRLLQRVARAIETAATRGSTLRLRLRPPELGSLRLEVALQLGRLTARIETETPHARALLLDSLPQLRARLAEQGMVVERFDVDVSARDADQSSSGSQEWDGPGSSPTPARRSGRAPAAPAEPPPAVPLASTTHPPGSLNVVI